MATETVKFARHLQPGDRVRITRDRVVTIDAVNPEPWAAQVSLAYLDPRSGASEWHPWAWGTQFTVI